MGIRNTTVGTVRTNALDNQRTNIHELRRIKSAIEELTSSGGGSATLTEQQTQTTVLNNILGELDYEHTVTYGRDTLVNTPLFIQNGLATQYQGGVTPPPMLTVVPAPTFTIGNSSNNNYYVDFALGTFSVRPNVILSIDCSIVSCDPASGDITLEYYGDGNLIQTINVISGGSTGDSATSLYNYDNSVTNYTTFNIFVYQIDTTGQIVATYSNVTIVDSIDSANFETNIVKKVERYSDGVLSSTQYFDYTGAPYTLVGTFIPDSRLESTYLQQLLLDEITNKADYEITEVTDINGDYFYQVKKINPDDTVSIFYVGQDGSPYPVDLPSLETLQSRIQSYVAGTYDSVVNIEAGAAFRNWEYTLGNSKVFNWIAGTVTPFIIDTIEYKTGITTIRTQTFTYDLDDNVLSITMS